MKRRTALGWSVATLVALGACQDDGAPLGNFDTRGRPDASRILDGAEPEEEPGSSTSSSSSGGVSPELDGSSGEVPDAVVADAPDGLPGLCRVEGTYGVTQPLAGLESVTQAASFTVTPDERVLAWLSNEDTLVHVASRASESVPFDPAATIVLADSTYPAPGAGLTISNDGLHLVVVQEGGGRLGELRRATLTDPFGPEIHVEPYAQIEPSADADSPLSAPVLGALDRILVVSRVRPAASSYPVLVSDRASTADPWPLPSPRTESLFAPQSAGSRQRTRVTGVSLDGLTFFVRNDATESSFAVNRPNEGGTFEPQLARELVAAQSIIPNAACTRLYVLEAGALGTRPLVLE